MKPLYEKIPQALQQSFLAKSVERESRPHLRQAWHFHPEIEICYTSMSKGRRFVGNQISNYQEDDLVLFGSNLPHGFTTEMRCKQVVIQMSPDFLGKEFMGKPELANIKNLIDRGKSGLEFEGKTKKKGIKIIKKLMKQEGFSQMIHLFELLNLLAESGESTPICSNGYALVSSEDDLNRIKIVYKFIMAHFEKPISVKDVADLLNLTEAGFYKFIKKHTNKTFTEILNEFRINNACSLLISTDKTISEICFASGYNNISHFNHRFKTMMGTAPYAFRVGYAG